MIPVLVMPEEGLSMANGVSRISPRIARRALGERYPNYAFSRLSMSD